VLQIFRLAQNEEATMRDDDRSRREWARLSKDDDRRDRPGQNLTGNFGFDRGGGEPYPSGPRADYDVPAYGSGRSRDSGREMIAPRSFRGVGPKNYRRSDDAIREDLCELLTDDPAVDATEIEVRVSEGMVTLDGTVRDRTMKHRAERLAESIRGVRDVQNNLQRGDR
jgi:hypothetical protein